MCLELVPISALPLTAYVTLTLPAAFCIPLFRLLHQINKGLIETIKRTKPSFGVNFFIIVIYIFKLIMKTQSNNQLTEENFANTRLIVSFLVSQI